MPNLQDTVARLGAIGDRPGDSPEQSLRHHLLIYMGSLMSVGGLVWGTLALYFTSTSLAVIPFGYVVITLANLTYFHKSKNFPVVRGVQVFFSLLLPFLFQWALGGFAASGNMMLWAILAIVATKAFGSQKASLLWGLFFIALTVVSGVIDAEMASRFTQVRSEGMRAAFFVINTTMISTILFGLTTWFLVQRDVLSQKLATSSAEVLHLNDHLEHTVLLRTAELQTAVADLGQANDRLMPLAKAWEQVWDPIEICDANGLVIFANPAFEKSTHEPSAPSGFPSQVIQQNPEALALLRSGTPAIATRRSIQAGTQQAREYQVTLSPVADVHGELSHIVIIHRDITERLKDERELMHQDRLASLGTLAAGMAHEINNPLAYIQANLEEIRVGLLARPDGHAPDLTGLEGLAAECLTGTKRVAEIVSTLMDAARPDHSTVGAVALQPLVRSCLRVVQHELPHKAQLDLVMPNELAYVHGNEAKLSQVLINLLLNALAAMESARADSNRLTVELSHKADKVLLEVSDTGTGISAELMPKLFNPFFTTKPLGEGLGLGLAMSHRIVTGMGGTIVPTSEVGVGSTFQVSLPIADPPQSTEVASVETTSDSKTAGRILIIDDMPQVARILARMLRSHDVTTVHKSDEALKHMQDTDFDVILCDIMMPGMTGLQLRTAIQATRPALAQRFIFVTGGIFSEVEHKSAIESACPIVQKPVNRKELLANVQSILAAG
ncbi:MAG: response regulator [Rhodobacterales bacterium]|nr:response regulator [Rhodobacterales bacterium]